MVEDQTRVNENFQIIAFDRLPKIIFKKINATRSPWKIFIVILTDPLRAYLAILISFPTPLKIQVILPKTNWAERYLILKILIQWFQNSFQIRL